MLYHYVATDGTGKLTEADYEADDLGTVLRYLSTKELRPITVEPLRREIRLFGVLGRINLTDKVFLAKYLALMLRVGTDLLLAINILIADFEKAAVKNFLLEVRDNLSHGRPFYESFAKYPKIFSSVFVNLVKAAEKSGNLQKTFEDLSKSLEEEAALRSKIRSALIYPVVILSASFGLFIFLASFALPRIAHVFEEGSIHPPFFSRVVFGVSLWVGSHLWLFIFGALFLVGLGIYFCFYNRIGRLLTQRLLSKTPGIRVLYREIAVQRFAATFSSLLKAGLPIIDSVKITADVVNSEDFRVALIRIADEGLAKGLTIGESFKREVVFPRVVTNLITISEKAGHLEEVLATLADFYAVNIDTSVKTLISLLEPALLLFMGVLVGTIALSIIVPIYQLTSQF